MFVSGNVEIPSGSGFFSGSGEGLFNMPITALTDDALITNQITSGSVTASVSPNRGFIVEDLEGPIRSELSGSLFVSGGISASFFSGSGEGLFNIPLSALAEEVVAATKIQEGNVTASVDEVEGFIVKSEASGSQFSGSLFVSGGVTLTDGIYNGDGSGLFHIPISNLAGDSPRIARGSATASVNP